MRFGELLIAAIRRSEIPLRFEPGAEEAVAKPVTEFLRAWLEAHQHPETDSTYQKGQQALIAELLDELDGTKEIPSG